MAALDDEATLIANVVAEYREDNNRWHKGGATVFRPADLPGGTYVGLDKELLQACLEVTALSWKMTQFRLQIPPEINPSNESEWNEACNEYHGFFNLTEPLLDSRMRRAAEMGAQTLRGLEAKARLFLVEWLGARPPDDETTGSKLGRSICRDIFNIMGFIDQ